MGENTGEMPNPNKMSRRTFLRRAALTAAGLAIGAVSGDTSRPSEKTETVSGAAAEQRALANWRSELQTLRQEGKVDAQGKLESSIIAASLEEINDRFPSLENKKAMYEEVTRESSPVWGGLTVVKGNAGAIVDNFLLGISLESQRQGQEIEPRNIEIYDTSRATALRLEQLLGRVDTPKKMRVVEESDGPRKIIMTLDLFMPSPSTGGGRLFGQAIEAGIQAVTQEPEPSG